MLRYLVRIWERDSQKKLMLRPIIPVVVYHGREQWQIAAQFSGSEPLRPYWPTFLYELHDLSRLDEAEIRGQARLQIGLLIMKYIFDPALNGRLAAAHAGFLLKPLLAEEWSRKPASPPPHQIDCWQKEDDAHWHR